MSDDHVTLEVEKVLKETEKAILVQLDEMDVWVPKSLIHDDSECYSMKSGPGRLIVPEWWAEKEGLA